jgi:type IV secretory pathway TrbL component
VNGAVGRTRTRPSARIGGAEMKKRASFVAAIFFWLIALVQVLRVLFRVEVTAGGVNIPLWVSILAVIVLGALGIWLWRERRE